MNTELITPYIHFINRGHGILVAKYLPTTRKVDLPLAVQFVADRMEFQGNEKMALLVIPGKGLQIDQDAQDYFAGPEGIRDLIATAILLEKGQYFEFATATFMLKVHRPAMPTQIFLREASALRWLITQQKKVLSNEY